MDTENVKQWKVGMIATCRSLLCRIMDIQQSPLGIKLYVIEFVDSGHVDRVPKHLLHEVEDLDEDEFLVFDTLFVASDVQETSVFTLQETADTNRHALLTDEEITAVAQAHLSPHTESQTKWAVKLFKGKQFCKWTL